MCLETQTSPHHVRKKLLKHTPAYLESVGRDDMTTLGSVADSPGGKGTVLRLILGATKCMPLRALSYIDTALRCAEMLPCEQLQIVHANNLGSRINGLDLQEVRRQALLLASVTSLHIAGTFPNLQKKILHAEDKQLDTDRHIPLAQLMFSQHSDLAEKLLAKGSKHGGDATAYVAAHFAFQDTDLLQLEPLSHEAPRQVSAERIVSIGCQQERLFYAARMGMRALSSCVEMVETAQLFTRHITPPYFVARGGEQSLEDALQNGVDINLARDPSSHRDITHLHSLIQQEI